MMLEFKYIKDKGDLDSERSVFKVISDCNLGDFIAFRTKETSEDGISSKIELPFGSLINALKGRYCSIIF